MVGAGEFFEDVSVRRDVLFTYVGLFYCHLLEAACVALEVAHCSIILHILNVNNLICLRSTLRYVEQKAIFRLALFCFLAINRHYVGAIANIVSALNTTQHALREIAPLDSFTRLPGSLLHTKETEIWVFEIVGFHFLNY